MEPKVFELATVAIQRLNQSTALLRVALDSEIALHVMCSRATCRQSLDLGNYSLFLVLVKARMLSVFYGSNAPLLRTMLPLRHPGLLTWKVMKARTSALLTAICPSNECACSNRHDLSALLAYCNTSLVPIPTTQSDTSIEHGLGRTQGGLARLVRACNFRLLFVAFSHSGRPDMA